MSMACYNRALHAFTACAVLGSKSRNGENASVRTPHTECVWVASNAMWAQNALNMFRKIMDARFPNTKYAAQLLVANPTASTTTVGIVTVYPDAPYKPTTRVLFRAYSRDPQQNPDPSIDPRVVVFDPGLIVPNLQRPPKGKP